MAKYTIRNKLSATKEIGALPTDLQRRVAAKIDTLADDPRPHGCEKIGGVEDTYRVRVSDYRIVYEVHDDVVTVLVVKVGHRREVYR